LAARLVVDNKPYYGSDSLGGLLGGHISIDRNGPECPCGNKGCLELYCSATAFREKIIEAHPES
jgi:predicted NBD/HSP70 family sugar kinase